MKIVETCKRCAKSISIEAESPGLVIDTVTTWDERHFCMAYARPEDEAAYAAWLEWVRADPCFICKDKDNHFGVPHGLATGDGKTRKDVPA